MFSVHFKRSIALIGATIVFLAGLYIWLCGKFSTPTQSLPTNVKEQVTYDSNRHQVIVTTSQGTTRHYSRNPKVQIFNNGKVKVTDRPFGFEKNLFMGLGYSNTVRAFVGINWAYFYRLDVFSAVGFTQNNNVSAIQPLGGVGYNFWSNTSVNVGINPWPLILSKPPEFGVFLSVKL